jgi:hypothetical protein
MSNEHSSDEQAETQDISPWVPDSVQDWLMSDEPPPINTVEVGPFTVAPSCITCGRLVRGKHIPAVKCGGSVKCESHSEWIPKANRT